MQSGREQLADWIERRGFQQQEAAVYLGLHSTEVSMYLSGRRTPGLDTAIQIERRAGIPVEAWTLIEAHKSDASIASEGRKPQITRA